MQLQKMASTAPAAPPSPNFALSIAKILVPSAAALFAEQFLLKALPSSGIMASTQLVIPKIYGMLMITNAFLPSCVMLYLGFGIVSAARKKYKVDLPTMYAVSTTEGDDAYKFNCCQRAHQQALETFPMFLASSFLGGIKHPILVSLSGLLWCYARVKFAHGYATGVPRNRYASKWGWHIWTSLGLPLLCTLSAGLSLLL